MSRACLRRSALRDTSQPAVVVAMAAVGVVKVPVDQVVHMVAVRNGFVAAIRAVNVRGFVPAAEMARSAPGRIQG